VLRGWRGGGVGLWLVADSAGRERDRFAYFLVHFWIAGVRLAVFFAACG